MSPKEETTRQAIEHYGPMVVQMAWRILPEAEEVNDIYQDTFLQFHAAICKGEEIEFPKAWLCRVALRAAYKRQRQRRRLTLFDEDTPDPRAPATDAKELERNLLLGRVRQLVAELPERQREVFVLRNFEGRSFAEIATALGCSAETARANE
ncbi:MAG: sigma-70 family RNA polymerase sigma factor [Candidatus Latescibacteria bacterium]|nr:sigma-70 family RNA polymerase sigma factor [Candidatus Latescibacterota bacterium]